MSDSSGQRRHPWSAFSAGMQERNSAPETGRPIAFGPFVLHPASRHLLQAGRAITLTRREFEILYLLARAPGRCYSKRQILDLVWGHGYAAQEHAVQSHVNRLRAKLDTVARTAYIETVRGIGYRFNDLWQRWG